MKDLKQPLTYEQQVEHLINVHNLKINDKSSAVEILKKVNYYRLSAYGIGLKDPNNSERYKDGISIDTLFRLYEFDSKLRNLIVHIVEQIEVQLKTQISNYMSLEYGAECYLNVSNFNDLTNSDGKSIHSKILDDFRKECELHGNAPFVKHHMNKYGGHFPFWVVIELFTFGNLSSIYKIMKDEDKKEIAKLYNTIPKYLGSWILTMVEIRNICAHYSRLYNMPLKQRPYLYKEHAVYRKTDINKLFPVILVIKRMLGNDSRWKSFETSLEALLEEYNDVVILSFIGFPNDWKDILNN